MNYSSSCSSGQSTSYLWIDCHCLAMVTVLSAGTVDNSVSSESFLYSVYAQVQCHYMHDWNSTIILQNNQSGWLIFKLIK